MTSIGGLSSSRPGSMVTEPRTPPAAYLSLLSSLASDLDLMLRSAPVRFTSTARLQLVRHDRLEGRGASANGAAGDDLQALLPSSNRSNRSQALGNINHNLASSRCSLSSDQQSVTPTSDLDAGVFAAGETSDSDTPVIQNERQRPQGNRPPLDVPSNDLQKKRPSQDEVKQELDDQEEESSYGAPCGLGLLERLLRSHPVWFLPGIQRAGAVHLLQGKEEGNFVVRGSSQPMTMAVSVRLPTGRGPYIEHYLVRASEGRVGLETSANRFDSIPELVAHYAQCCDELPVQLTLPQALREARNRQQLSSLALLGQEFWRHPATPLLPPPRPSTSADSLGESSSGSEGASDYTSDNGNNKHMNPLEARTPSPFSDPADQHPSQRIQMTTFKGPRAPRPTPPCTLDLNIISTGNANGFDRIPARVPPIPPPRWSKPATPPLSNDNSRVPTLSKRMSPEGECFASTINSNTSGSMRVHKSKVNASLVTSPIGSSGSPGATALTSPDSNNGAMAMSGTNSSVMSPMSCVTSPASGVTSPMSGVTSPHTKSGNNNGSSGRSRRGAKAARKASRHYQESDILESPGIYCRSGPGDKASDYEDVWGPADAALISKHRPDLLSDHTPICDTTNNGNALSPLDSGNTTITPPDAKNPSNSPATEAETPAVEALAAPSQNGGGTSPFYAEPADAIIKQQIVLRRPRGTGVGLRHSEPSSGRDSSSFYAFGSRFPPHPALQRIDSSEELSSSNFGGPASGSIWNGQQSQQLLLGSVDDLQRRSAARRRKGEAWTVDRSWEFVARGDLGQDTPFDVPITGNEADWSRIGFPSDVNNDDDLIEPPSGPKITVREMIAKRLPDLGLPEPTIISSNTSEQTSRMSAYDNVEGRIISGPALSSRESDDGTVFSEPWDCSRWQGLLLSNNNNNNNDAEANGGQQQPVQKRHATIGRNRAPPLERPCAMYVSSPRTTDANGSAASVSNSCQQPPQGVRKGEPPGIRVRRYALQLARDKSTTFAQNVDHFIACTRDGRERQPHVVMRNMRQFMSGMKNYLLKHGERGFEREVQLARARLRGDEFLNLDALLESVMQKLVAVPLREHLYALFVEWCATRGDIELMAENIKLAAEYEPRELGLRACVTPPNEAAMSAIAEQLTLLQEAESPLDKLDKLLRAVALVFEGTGGIKVVSADDFLPLLILMIARCGMVGAEIESEIMWGLLQPSLLSGEAGYYLTALSSAVHVLKSLGAGCKETSAPCFSNGATATNSSNLANGASDGERPRLLLPACGSLLRVVVPDEHNGSLQTRTLPVRPHTTAKEVCRIIAHRARVTNPQDYGLFKLVDGEESLLGDGECPQEARMSAEGKHCVLAYKRIDAKIAWPTQVTSDEDC